MDELYQRYQADPSSVDRAWWNFFADYHPSPEQAAPAPPAPASPPAPAASPPAGFNGSAPQAAPPAPPAPPAPAAPAPAAPAAPAAPRLAPAPAPAPSGEQVRLRGAAARTVANMSASLAVPTATSVRAIPAKLVADNRIVINNHLARGRGGKVSFTHLIGYALVRALAVVPEMNNSYADVDGKPVLVQPGEINLGLAIDIRREDGSRQLLVPSIKSAQNMDFRQFWGAYEDIVRKARSGKLTVEDFAGTTISLTNPGTIGTEHSVPRLMQGQGCIVGVGAMEYPAAYQGASAETIARMA
ncbi:MAG TPA: 2-oxo acid dehydrogenase subunit E2, partial [Streptosporangiaceae bacterium]|nr:2-oxo acid dehydrogenase subunit E2 [Streptosporangiaceae bacterium]